MKKTILLFILFFSFVCLSAQEVDEPSVITYSNNDYKKYIIAEIKIRGAENCGYKDYMLTNIPGLSIGDKVSIPGDEITSAFKAFLKQGLFQRGEILATKQTADSVWLELILQSNPVVFNINFIGVERSEKEELETKIGIVRGSQLTHSLIDRAEKRIKDFFIEKGFSNAEVRIRQKNDVTNMGKVIVDVVVNKNRKTKVRCIHIVGNNLLSNNALKAIMKNTNEKFSLKKGFGLSLRKLFSTKKFIKEKYDKDFENIILKYNEKGYRDACIVSDSIVFVKNDQIDIYLTIDEGNRYYFRNINWVGNTLYSSENLSHVLDIKSGDIYDLTKLNARLLTDKNAVSNLYYNNGYIFSFMNPVEVCIENDSVDVEIQVLEGIQTAINRISINGNDRVYEDVIRRELVTKPGDLFSKEVIMRSVQGIVQMGYFDPESINVQPISDPETGMVDIIYNLTPKINDQIEFSAGWGGENNGIIGRLNLKFSNFSIKNLVHLKEYKGITPQGDGQTLTLGVQTNGTHYQLYKVSFLEPWMGGRRPNSFLFNIGYEKMKEKDTSSIKIYNFSAGYNKRLGWLDDNYSTFTPSLSYRCFWPKFWGNFPFDNTRRVHDLIVGLALGRNSTDNSAYTCQGSIFSLSVDATLPYSFFLLQASDSKDKWIEYYKWKFRSRVFVPLVKKEKVRHIPVLMGVGEYGFVGTYNHDNDVFFGTFCMGSNRIITSYSTKSYDFNENIGLRGYAPSKKEEMASVYMKLALELRYPFVLDQKFIVYGLTFMEAGSIGEKINFFELKRSAGVGMRVLMPMIGLMGVDWAYAFDEPFIGIESNSQFHFIFGKEF